MEKLRQEYLYLLYAIIRQVFDRDRESIVEWLLWTGGSLVSHLVQQEAGGNESHPPTSLLVDPAYSCMERALCGTSRHGSV